jgi:malonyl-CoA decarboxylase
LLEQIIRHEAVHEIDGWDDLRRRLQPDRRCFAFFHPQLPDEPLIFVEVALLPEMADAIAPLDRQEVGPASAESFKVAVFYSISNCQPGLRNVSLGNFLIKRVAERLKRELPQLKTFCTCRRFPLCCRGCQGEILRRPAGIKPQQAEHAVRALADLRKACGRRPRRAVAARHVAHAAHGRAPGAGATGSDLSGVRLVHAAGDPVARFHLDNGARLERLNAHGQPVGQGAETVGRADGQLPLRPVAHRDLPRSFRARAGGTFPRTFGAAVARTGSYFKQRSRCRPSGDISMSRIVQPTRRDVLRAARRWSRWASAWPGAVVA